MLESQRFAANQQFLVLNMKIFWAEILAENIQPVIHHLAFTLILKVSICRSRILNRYYFEMRSNGIFTISTFFNIIIGLFSFLVMLRASCSPKNAIKYLSKYFSTAQIKNMILHGAPQKFVRWVNPIHCSVRI